MKILSAGWGPPPEDVSFDVAVNTSRMLTKFKCGQLHKYIYEDRRVPDRETSPALQLGTVWHEALELLWRGLTAHDIISQYEAEEWAVDSSGKTQLEWFRNALVAYEDRYHGDWPGGQVLATEQDFWLRVRVDVEKPFAYPYSPVDVLIRGRVDRLCAWHGQLVNGEIKTAAAGTKMDRYMQLRSSHLQDALYYLAMTHAPKTLPNGVTLPGEPYGTVYDITQKYTYPASRWKDKDARRMEWRTKLFYTEAVAWNTDRAERVAAKSLSDYLAMAGTAHRNIMACDAYSGCPYVDVCHGSLSLASLHFKDRDDDYVDEIGASDD